MLMYSGQNHRYELVIKNALIVLAQVVILYICPCSCLKIWAEYLGDNCNQIFYLGRYIVGYTFGNRSCRRSI